jgi:hypothetical protein
MFSIVVVNVVIAEIQTGGLANAAAAFRADIVASSPPEATAMPPDPREEFLSEPIHPEEGNFTTDLMMQGLASLPGAFLWRGRRYAVLECLEHIKESSREGSSAQGDLYLRRQRFTVRLEGGAIARIYVERHARSGASPRATRQRWFIYSIRPAPPDETLTPGT